MFRASQNFKNIYSESLITKKPRTVSIPQINAKLWYNLYWARKQRNLFFSYGDPVCVSLILCTCVVVCVELCSVHQESWSRRGWAPQKPHAGSTGWYVQLHVWLDKSISSKLVSSLRSVFLQFPHSVCILRETLRIITPISSIPHRRFFNRVWE